MPGTIKEAHLSFADRCLRWFCWGVVHTVQRPKVCGPKPPIEGPTIYACRHVGLMDPVILMVEYFRWMIRPLVAKDYYDKNNFTGKTVDKIIVSCDEWLAKAGELLNRKNKKKGGV